MIPLAVKNVWLEGLSSDVYKLKLCGAGGGGRQAGVLGEEDEVRRDVARVIEPALGADRVETGALAVTGRRVVAERGLLGAAAAGEDRLLAAAGPILAALRDMTGESAQLYDQTGAGPEALGWSITRWQEYIAFMNTKYGTRPATSNNGQFLFANPITEAVDATQFSQEFRITSDNPESRLDWIAGAYFKKDDIEKTDRLLGKLAGVIDEQTRAAQALEETIAWYLANERWWRAVMDGTYRQWIEHNYAAR